MGTFPRALAAALLAAHGAALAQEKAHLDKLRFLEAVALTGRSAESDVALFGALVGEPVEVAEDLQAPLRGATRSFVALRRAQAPDRIAGHLMLRFGLGPGERYVLVADVALEPRFECLRLHDLAAKLGPARDTVTRGVEVVAAAFGLASGASARFAFAADGCARWLMLRRNAD